MASRNGISKRFIAGFSLAVSLVGCGVPRYLPTSVPGPTTSAMRAPAVQTSTGVRRFGLRFTSQTPHVRFVSGGLSAGLPSRVDLRSAQTSVRDQGAIGSCTGFAIAGLAEYTERQQQRSGTLSPAFIYTMELQAEGNLGQDAGASLQTGMGILNKQGIAPESAQPYLSAADQHEPAAITSFLSTLPSAAALSAAASHRLPKIKAVADLNAFKTALAKGKPVVFGIPVYSSVQNPGVSTSGIFPVPDTEKETLLGGHALLAVGYDDQRQQVIFKNSWSPSWGDKGFGYLPYGFFAKDLVMDAWQAQ